MSILKILFIFGTTILAVIFIFSQKKEEVEVDKVSLHLKEIEYQRSQCFEDIRRALRNNNSNVKPEDLLVCDKIGNIKNEME